MRLTEPRRGFGLVEMIIAGALAALIGAIAVSVLVNQQRFFRAASESLEVRTQLRDGLDVLVTDIRSAAVARLGVPLMTDSAIELFSVTGTSVACTSPTASVISLPPLSLASGTTLTSFITRPDTGDLALAYVVDGATGIDRWDSFRITSFTTRSAGSVCPPPSSFTSDADAAADAYQLTVAGPLPQQLRKGSPLRVVRRARYSLYRSGDSKWYLGYRRCNAIGASACAVVQPVSGPYMAYASSGPTGLMFRYYDASGTELTQSSPDTALARVDITLRGESAGRVKLAGDASARYRDSALVSVSPRNRLR